MVEIWKQSKNDAKIFIKHEFTLKSFSECFQDRTQVEQSLILYYLKPFLEEKGTEELKKKLEKIEKEYEKIEDDKSAYIKFLAKQNKTSQKAGSKKGIKKSTTKVDDVPKKEKIEKKEEEEKKSNEEGAATSDKNEDAADSSNSIDNDVGSNPSDSKS